MFAAAMAPPLLQCAALLLCPESPAWPLPLLQQLSGVNSIVFFSTEARGVCESGSHGAAAAAVEVQPAFACHLHQWLPPPLALVAPQVFQRAGLKSPILGSIAVGATNLCERGGRGAPHAASFPCRACAYAFASLFCPSPRHPSPPSNGRVPTTCRLPSPLFFPCNFHAGGGCADGTRGPPRPHRHLLLGHGGLAGHPGGLHPAAQ
jgi:hypothetical protein